MIRFVQNIQEEVGKLLAAYRAEDIFVLTDERVAAVWLERIFSGMGIKKERILIMEGGEGNKTLDNVEMIWRTLSMQNAGRCSLLINLGGGVIADVGGFAAACYKRGIRSINIPTTLLAQVDASVGGKTGVNFRGLKNEIGAFHTPEEILIAPCFLQTLPERELLSGFAEMIKHGLLAGGMHLRKIISLCPVEIVGGDLSGLIRESVGIKKQIVDLDPKESGIRKALNFGHTVAHALESLFMEEGYELLHGEAVAMGMKAELYLSVTEKKFCPDQYQKICQFIDRIYPLPSHALNIERLYALMLHDKKNIAKKINFTLLEAPGKYSIDNFCPQEKVINALNTLK